MMGEVVMNRSRKASILTKCKYPLIALASFAFIILGAIAVPKFLIQSKSKNNITGVTSVQDNVILDFSDTSTSTGESNDKITWYEDNETPQGEYVSNGETQSGVVDIDYSSISVRASVRLISGDAYEAVGTPQYKAFETLSNNKRLNGKLLPNWKQIQRYLLLVIKYSFGGKNMDDIVSENGGSIPDDLNDIDKWQMDEDECDWKGIVCTKQTVTQIDISGDECVGTIPPEIGYLSDIDYLDLARTGISGSIPEELYDLRYLKMLTLSKNNLAGTLSEKIGQLTNLVDLRLDYNSLSGRIPDGIGTLTEARFILLRSNKFSRNLPYTVGGLENVYYFDASMNKLRGELPRSFAKLRMLGCLYLDHNLFDGTIPKEWNSFNPYIEVMHLNDNRLTGGLPESWGLLNIMGKYFHNVFHVHFNEKNSKYVYF
uniref:Leucine-rich repeat-containing N-terminal plant-type domain-containing protein n=1 Tax=Corethron hystrix TaxID=216773 RepID=A0A7S1FMK1_9STRA|mmetsp:Transcript_16262/g.36577  ORF Transcript_16262/g.36577 Transcript_16262/m.36577 type:complete len:429 (+) Transcript_16262:178-1464(+)